MPELYFLLVGLCASMRALAIAPWPKERCFDMFFEAGLLAKQGRRNRNCLPLGS